MMQTPSFEWYAAKSHEMNGPTRCPLAAANRCPRYYASLWLLGDAGITTKISQENKAKLDRQWKDFESTIGEEDASISGGERNDEKAMSNFCPEVSYNIFGLFASGLYPHHGEIDRDLAHTRLAQEGAKHDDPRWYWANLTPRHYTECPEYSILQGKETSLMVDKREKQAAAGTGGTPHEIMTDKSPEPQKSKNPKCVFVVHGRNTAVRDSMFAFLRAIGLQPLEWSQAVKETGEGSPYIGHVLDTAFSMAQAIVVLMTPDDEVRLREEFHSAHDDNYEKQLTPQARPNVLFEAGMAMGRNPKRTVLVQVGQLRPFSDIGGRHVLRLKNTSPSRQELADRLKTAGCDVDLSGTDWHNAGSFVATAEDAEQNKGVNIRDETINNLNAQICEYGIAAHAMFHHPSSLDVEVVNVGREKIIINKMEATFENGETETKPPQLAKLNTGNTVLRPIELNQKGDIQYAEGINTIFHELPIKLVLIDTLGTCYPVEDLEKAITELNEHPLSAKRIADGLRNAISPEYVGGDSGEILHKCSHCKRGFKVKNPDLIANAEGGTPTITCPHCGQVDQLEHFLFK